MLKRALNFFKENFFNFIMLTIGSILAAFAIEQFLYDNQILDGGIVGISIIISTLTAFPLSILTWILNIPFLLIGAKKKGHRFVIRALYSMTIFSIALEVLEATNEITDEHLLAVAFGGLFLGVGVGLVLRYGGCLDGTEIIALLLSPKIHVPVGTIILTFNIFIYGAAGILFGADRALYSILTYFIVSFIMDKVENGFEQEKGVMIFTEKDNEEEIKNRIYNELGRTCTAWIGQGYISSADKTILYCVISKFEIKSLRDIVADYSAFVTITDISEIIGKHIKSESSDENYNNITYKIINKKIK